MLLLVLPALADPRADAQSFLDQYNSLYVALYTLDSGASWDASTDVSDENSGRRTAADQALAAFEGDAVIIARTQALLAQADQLDPLQVTELRRILVNAAANPGNVPALVNARLAAETKAAAIQDGFVYCQAHAADGTCTKSMSANDIDDDLVESKDVQERLATWTLSKTIGVPLKQPLADAVKLRNAVARANGFSSFFGLQVAEYGMTTDEMMTMLDGFSADMKPLQDELTTWLRYTLAARYDQPVPTGDIPAHWATNRWAQEYDGLVTAADYDPYFKDKTPEWIVKSAEDFYVSLGFPALPATFWQKSDLYPVPAGQTRHKNSHASAWHMDLNQDLRSLMSVQNDTEWFGTAHHELGHIYYFMSYSRPEVPPVLREGANRAFHEAVGELINVAAMQVPYLRQRNILPKNAKIDPIQDMLNQALVQTVAFIPFSSGTMARFEYELYEKDLPPDQWQTRWWQLVSQYQHVAPPDAARLTDPTLCDACTKTHIIDDPGGYYDYALATVIKYQLHEHIAKEILHQDPHACNYYGNKEVGAFLKSILEKGATEDWRKVLRDATGEDVSTRPMVEYFEPLRTWLQKENARLAKDAAKKAKK